MKNISTRSRIVIVSLAVALIYLFLPTLEIGEIFIANTKVDLLRALIIASVTYLGTFWALFFKVRGERFFTVLLFPVVGVFLISLLGELIFLSLLSGFGQATIILFTAIFIGFYLYLSVLTVNILNISFLENIPLALAARGSLFIIALIDAYLLFFMLFSNDLNILIKLLIIFLMSGLLVNMCLWSVEYSLRSRLLVALAIGMILTLLGFILSIWPLIPPYLALIMSLFFYTFLNISMEVREIIGKWIWFEYFTLVVLVFLFLLLLPEWGINGSVFF
jgi:hypothetical protein